QPGREDQPGLRLPVLRPRKSLERRADLPGARAAAGELRNRALAHGRTARRGLRAQAARAAGPGRPLRLPLPGSGAIRRRGGLPLEPHAGPRGAAALRRGRAREAGGMRLAASSIAWPAGADEEAAAVLRAGGAAGVELAPTKVWASPAEATEADARAQRAFW